MPAMCFRLHDIAEVLNNASVGAVIGAFLATVGAVTAVLMTDSIRDRRRARRTLPARIELARDLAVNRHAAINQRGIAPAGTVNLVIASAEFEVDSVKRLLSDCFDRLSARQRRAIGNVIGSMEHADRLNVAALQFQVSARSNVPVNVIDAENVMREELMWLDRVANLCNAYLSEALTEVGGYSPSQD